MELAGSGTHTGDKVKQKCGQDDDLQKASSQRDRLQNVRKTRKDTDDMMIKEMIKELIN